jgi:hypothetical protein
MTSSGCCDESYHNALIVGTRSSPDFGIAFALAANPVGKAARQTDALAL